MSTDKIEKVKSSRFGKYAGKCNKCRVIMMDLDMLVCPRCGHDHSQEHKCATPASEQ